MPEIRTYVITQVTETIVRYGFEGPQTERMAEATREAHRYMLNPTPSLTSKVTSHRITEETVSELSAREELKR